MPKIISLYPKLEKSKRQAPTATLQLQQFKKELLEELAIIIKRASGHGQHARTRKWMNQKQVSRKLNLSLSSLNAPTRHEVGAAHISTIPFSSFLLFSSSATNNHSSITFIMYPSGQLPIAR